MGGSVEKVLVEQTGREMLAARLGITMLLEKHDVWTLMLRLEMSIFAFVDQSGNVFQ